MVTLKKIKQHNVMEQSEGVILKKILRRAFEAEGIASAKDLQW